MKHIPRKRFGQHFLADAGIIEAIVRAIDPKPADAMVEIGPGLAAGGGAGGGGGGGGGGPRAPPGACSPRPARPPPGRPRPTIAAAAGS
ncbi:MAG: hypothetical protein LH617_00575, partial [Ramlibacter sp.]|nr:hypothetical protein [Ramlibacter sp.]